MINFRYLFKNVQGIIMFYPTDIDECANYDPCWENEECVNLQGKLWEKSECETWLLSFFFSLFKNIYDMCRWIGFVVAVFF